MQNKRKKRLFRLSVGLCVLLACGSIGYALRSAHSSENLTQVNSEYHNTGFGPHSKSANLHLKKMVHVKPTLTILQENHLPGTTAWKIHKPANGRIQGYASLTSVNSGGNITLFVSTRLNGTKFNIKFFRLGYYGGKGGRLVKQSPLLTGRAEGWWNSATGRHHLPSPNRSGFLQLRWHPSYQLHVPTDWVSGYYVGLLTDAHGYQSYIPFVVRDDDRAHELLVEVPVNTWEAYNYWGDYSFYGHYDAITRKQKGYDGNNAEAVSFDRPYSQDNGAGLTFLEYPTVYWMEKQGYNVAYTSSINLNDPTRRWTPKGVISIAHDEYWSAAMRDNVQRLLGKGVNFAFLGANDMYWKVRYADNYRTMIGYRWESMSDPLHGTSDETGAWRYVGAPENKLLGEMYDGVTVHSGYPEWTIADPKSWLFHGLHVYKGETVPRLIGWEFDSTANNIISPSRHVTVLAKSPVYDYVHHSAVRYQTTTLYKAPSGAYVFDAGTIWWGYGLSNPLHYQIDEGMSTPVPDNQPPSPIIQGVTKNLLNKFL